MLHALDAEFLANFRGTYRSTLKRKADCGLFASGQVGGRHG